MDDQPDQSQQATVTDEQADRLARLAARRARRGGDGDPDGEDEVPVRAGGARRGVQRWSRTLHVYASMVCFVVVLFFALTGITLNHPTWVFGSAGSQSTVTGTLPADWKKGDQVDWLRVAEYLRSTHDLRGTAGDNTADALTAFISFKGPGYEADVQIDAETGTYQVQTAEKGFLAVMNDLHKGRDTKSSWRWLIDVVGGILAFVSLSGLVLQLVLRKRRRSSMITAGVGAAAVLVLGYLTTR